MTITDSSGATVYREPNFKNILEKYGRATISDLATGAKFRILNEKSPTGIRRAFGVRYLDIDV